MPGSFLLSINQHFSESQTWLCLWDIICEIQKAAGINSAWELWMTQTAVKTPQGRNEM